MKEFIKFVYRFIINLGKFFLISVPLQAVGAVVLGIYFLFSKNQGQLPYGLRWFDCADYYVGRDITTIYRIRKEGNLRSYLWLAWRNPINYFSYKYMGINLSYADLQRVMVIIHKGSSNIGDSTDHYPGLFYLELLIKNKTYYHYYYILKYRVFGQTKCFRFRMGWKLDGYPVHFPVQDVFVISPYHVYNGK